MKAIISDAKKVLIERQYELEKITDAYNAAHFKFKKEKTPILKQLSEISDEDISQDYKKKIAQNFDHLQLRIKEGKMPRAEITAQQDEIKQCLNIFADTTVLTAEQTKKYDTLSRLYLQILLQKNNSIISRHQDNLNSYKADFEQLGKDYIKKYLQIKKSYVAEVEKTKDEMFKQLKSLFTAK